MLILPFWNGYLALQLLFDPHFVLLYFSINIGPLWKFEQPSNTEIISVTWKNNLTDYCAWDLILIYTTGMQNL